MEAKIARSLVRGASLREIAVQQELTLNTTRWYVKQILQKTESDSQMVLLRKLLTGPAAVLPLTSEPSR
jgi:DNA-binding CsgD family transcriptional regulator